MGAIHKNSAAFSLIVVLRGLQNNVCRDKTPRVVAPMGTMILKPRLVFVCLPLDPSSPKQHVSNCTKFIDAAATELYIPLPLGRLQGRYHAVTADNAPGYIVKILLRSRWMSRKVCPLLYN